MISFTHITTMEDLQEPFNYILKEFISKSSLNDFTSSCQYKNTLVIETAEKIVELLNNSKLEDNKQIILNHITSRYLLKLHKDYMAELLNIQKKNEENTEFDEELNKTNEINEEINNNNLHYIFSLIDLSICIDETYTEYSYAMNTFVNVLSYLYPTEFIIKYFVPIFFNENGKERLLLLTKGNKLQGKVKPGSRLLVIYKQIINRIPTFEVSNQEIIAKFRHLISNSLEISDKLTQISDWHMANKKINGYYSSFENFYNLKKYNTLSMNPLSKNHPRNIFNELIILNKALTTTSENELIECVNKEFMGQKQSNTTQLKLWVIDNINKSLNNISYHDHRQLEKIPLNDITEKQFKWVLDEEIFNKQLKTYDFFYSLKLQLAILINFFNERTFDKCKNESEIILSEYSKFKKPDSFLNPINSIEAKRKLSDWYVYSMNGFKQKNYHYLEILNLLEKNEKTFQKMKLKNFVYPNIEQLNENLQPKKRKFEDYITETNDLDSIIVNKKPKFIHLMGTPKLTKLWKVEKNVSWKDSEDVMESVKDDIYFARGTYEENPKDMKNAETYHRLCWKGLRSVKETGNWLQLAQSNEYGQLENETWLF